MKNESEKKLFDEENPWSIKVKDNIDSDKFKYNIKKLDIETPQNINEIRDIIKDVLAGDKQARSNPVYSSLNFEGIRKALDWLQNTNQIDNSMKLDLAENSWKLNFKSRPPTMSEFLTPEYIGAQATTLFDPVRDTLIDFWNPLKPYRSLILYTSIGWGKSLLTIISNLYSACHYGLMWNPWRYLNQSPGSVFVLALASWSQKKGSELYFEPMQQIIEQSPYFVQVRTREKMKEVEEEFEKGSSEFNGCLPYTTATKTSLCQFAGGLNVKLVSSTGGQMGLNILNASFSELAFFVDEGGWSEEKIWQFYSKTTKRIDNRMKGNFYGRSILDSSPNNLECCIDKFIVEDAEKDPKNLCIKGSRWKWFPQDFPGFYDKDKNEVHSFDVAFPFYKGGNGKPPKVVETPEELRLYDTIDIIWCPKDQITDMGTVSFLGSARTNALEFMRDWAALPAGTQERIFYDSNTIEKCFKNNLKNIYTYITAPAEEEPEHLIWNQIRDTFFYKIADKWFYYYEPSVARVLSIDQSISGDQTCIGMSHVERSQDHVDSATGDYLPITVTDFTINIIPKGGRINLDAIRMFIRDLVVIGQLRIKHVSFDKFESESAQQYLKRNKITVDYVTADKINEPYLIFIDLVWKERWQCGKNIFVKNNMKSLQMIKRKQTGTTKIDHTNGELVQEGDAAWESSFMGQNAKDATDTIAENCYLLSKYSNEFVPYVEWNPDVSFERSYNIAKEDKDKILEKLRLC